MREPGHGTIGGVPAEAARGDRFRQQRYSTIARNPPAFSLHYQVTAIARLNHWLRRNGTSGPAAASARRRQSGAFAPMVIFVKFPVKSRKIPCSEGIRLCRREG